MVFYVNIECLLALVNVLTNNRLYFMVIVHKRNNIACLRQKLRLTEIQEPNIRTHTHMTYDNLTNWLKYCTAAIEVFFSRSPPSV